MRKDLIFADFLQLSAAAELFVYFGFIFHSAQHLCSLVYSFFMSEERTCLQQLRSIFILLHFIAFYVVCKS